MPRYTPTPDEIVRFNEMNAKLLEEMTPERRAQHLKMMETLRQADLLEPTYPNPMQAPWVAFPTIRRFSLGWRMGGGEDYMHTFKDWFRALPPSDQHAFREANPEPEEWSGFFDLILSERQD